ncbi:MAG: DNA polymerase III subunit delta' [Pseudomonadota bacterium]|nr:DNA polymerase III subunit delta' [Pseudomonadota bacterium]
MPGFESITDQKRPVRILTAFLRKGTIPHALLFTGIEGVGKQTAAKIFAMACNCLGEGPEQPPVNSGKTGLPDNHRISEPCDICRSCRKILSNSHPDVIQIRPSGYSIRISQIRDLCEILSLKPYEAKVRVVIISDAQAMNVAAGNALLKILEEPPDRTILILTAAEKTDLISTVSSRCQNIKFNPVSRKKIAQILSERKGVDPVDADIFAGMSNGSLSGAFNISGKLLKKRDWLISELESLSINDTGRCLAFAERLSKDKDDFLDSLEAIDIWYRDMAVFRHSPGKIIFIDLSDKMRTSYKKHSEQSLISKFEEIRMARQAIRANGNLRLTAETLVLKLAQI